MWEESETTLTYSGRKEAWKQSYVTRDTREMGVFSVLARKQCDSSFSRWSKLINCSGSDWPARGRENIKEMFCFWPCPWCSGCVTNISPHPAGTQIKGPGFKWHSKNSRLHLCANIPLARHYLRINTLTAAVPVSPHCSAHCEGRNWLWLFTTTCPSLESVAALAAARLCTHTCVKKKQKTTRQKKSIPDSWFCGLCDMCPWWVSKHLWVGAWKDEEETRPVNCPVVGKWRKKEGEKRLAGKEEALQL